MNEDRFEVISGFIVLACGFLVIAHFENHIIHAVAWGITFGMLGMSFILDGLFDIRRK